MEVRDARPADATAISTVARESWHAAYDDILGEETVRSTVEEWYDTASLREQIRETAAGGGCFLVAENGGEVVGFGNAGPARDWGSDPDAPDAFFSRLYVAPDHWNNGIGTTLTAHIARILQDSGHERVWLEVFAENETGRRFYESLGFERVGSVPETFGEKTVTTLHLAISLPALIEATPTPD